MSLTLLKLYEDIGEILKKNPEFASLPCIYSSDDEGNSYQKVNNSPSLLQVEDPKEYYLEVVGYEGEEDVTLETVNAVIIN